MKIWQLEPNSCKFMYGEYVIEITRQRQFGFLIGYIYIPCSNIYHGIEYDQLQQIIKSPIELTYSSLENGLWKIGFDAGSISDYIPNESVFDDFFDEMFNLLDMPKPTEKDYKNLEFMIERAKFLITLIQKKTEI